MKEELKKLVDRIIALPELIKESETKLAAFTLKHNGLTENIGSIESGLMLEICAEIDADGKVVFSNAEKRSAELNNRKLGSAEYPVVNEELSKVDYDLSQEKINLNFLVNEFRMVRSVLQFMSRQEDY